MIHQLVADIVKEINNYIKIKTDTADCVLQSTLLKQDGTISDGISGKVVLSLVNIEEDRISREIDFNRKTEEGKIEKLVSPVKLNLYLLFSANYPTDYNEALKMLSYVIGFFQKRNRFSNTNTPGLKPEFQTINIEIVSLNFEQQNHLWGAMGAKYIPSVLYKLRLIEITDDEIRGSDEPITQIHINEDKS